MELSPISERYLFIFFLLGHSTFNPYSYKSRCLVRFNFLPSILFLIITVSLSIFSLTFQYWYDQFFRRTVDKVISCLFIMSAFLSCLTILHRTTITNKKLQNLWHKFQVIEEFTNRRRKGKMCFQPFIKSYFRKVCIVLVFYVLHVYVKVINRFSSNDIINKSPVLILQLITNIALLHIIFYVDLLTYIVLALNENANVAFEHNSIVDLYDMNIKDILAKYRLYKHAHYLIWDISQFINVYFGWILLALLLQNFINVIYSAYWAILFVHSDNLNDTLRILSKLIFNS